MVGDELVAFAKTVKSRQDFVKFVEYLNNDYQQKSHEWGNRSIESFLGGLAGFANSMHGYYRNMGEEMDVESITWRIAADMLLAATVYSE